MVTKLADRIIRILPSLKTGSLAALFGGFIQVRSPHDMVLQKNRSNWYLVLQEIDASPLTAVSPRRFFTAISHLLPGLLNGRQQDPH